MSLLRSHRARDAIVWTLVAFSVLTLAAPTVVILGASFTAGPMIAFPPEGLSLRWYAKVAGSADLRDAFGRSTAVALLCTALALPAGVLAALALGRYRVHFARTLQLWLLLPFTVPLIAAGMGLMLLYGEAGVLGQLWPVGVACCVINLPFMLWAVLAPGVITGGLLMFVLAFNEFLVSLLLTDAYTVTLPVAIYNSIRNVITPDLAAVSVVYIAVAALVIVVIDRVVGLEIFLRSR
jgi:putative spermidine/putrescine transport system permease protein